MTDGIAIFTRFALYADLALLFGVPMFGLYALRGDERAPGAVLRFRLPFAVLALLALGFSVLGIWAMAAAMSGVPLGEVDMAAIRMLVTETSIGLAWQVRVVALLLMLLQSVAGWRRPARALTVAAALAGVALGSLAWTGHAAMDEGVRGWVHLAADIGHLLAGGVWLGALAALTVLIVQPASRMTAGHVLLLHRAVREFAVTGMIVVGLIVVTGLINSWILVGIANAGSLFTTLYGRLLLLKLALFAAMVCLAAANRFRLTPNLGAAIAAGEHYGAVARLRRSIISETLCATAILGLVAWLGTLSPPASGM